MLAHTFRRAVLWGLAALVVGCASPRASAPASAPAAASGQSHIVYLHGRIVQDQGVDATSPEYGRYEFHAIVEALGARGAQVHAPVRTPGTTVDTAAEAVVDQVQDLIGRGVEPERITVIGASHGAVIALRVATLLAEPRLSFVLLAACNDWVFDTMRPRLHGRVLSIHELGDRWGGTCRPLVTDVAAVPEFEEIELRTGLSHGFLYRPLPEWVAPALDWVHRDVRPAAPR